MRYGNQQPEAPTHLGSHQLPLPPEWLPAEDFDDDDDDGPTRAARARGAWTPAPAADISISGPTRQPTERSASPLLLEQRIEKKSDRAHPDDVRREPRRRPSQTVEGHKSKSRSAPSNDEERRSFVASGEVNARPSSSKSKSKKVEEKSRSAPSASSASAPSASAPSKSEPSARGSAPALDAAKLQQQQAAALAAMGAIDPMAVPVPPELAGPIYSWIRRLALQADLIGADKVLREAFVDLTSSLSVAIIYPGADGLWTLGEDEEIPKEATPLVAVAQARRAMISSHTALIPIVTSTETVAVVVLTRNPRNPGFHPIEQVAAIALARETAAILHHLAVAHLQRASEIKADQGGLYRGEALEAHRTRGNEGVPVNLSPSWVRIAYPILIVGILGAIAYAIFAKVPQYSSGGGVVVLPGTAVTSPAGTVAEVLVKPQQFVRKGTLLVKLYSPQEEASLAAAKKDYDNYTTMYLFDQQDEQTRKALHTAITKYELEEQNLENRRVRASVSGTVADIRVRQGSPLAAGDQVLQIVSADAEPEVWAFLPGKDRPRLQPGKDLQVEIVGYTKSREHAKISYVSPEAFGGREAAKVVGGALADSIKLAEGQQYVWVRAKLPGKTFKTQNNKWFYHHGMPVKAEVKLSEKPFIVTLLPSLGKYIPD